MLKFLGFVVLSFAAVGTIPACSDEGGGGTLDGGTVTPPPPPPAEDSGSTPDTGSGGAQITDFAKACSDKSQCQGNICCIPGTAGCGPVDTDAGGSGDGGGGGGGTGDGGGDGGGTGGGAGFCTRSCTTGADCPDRLDGTQGKCNNRGICQR